MLVVRPAMLKDRTSFIELARLAGPGFTSLAVSDAELTARLKKSEKSFAVKANTTGDRTYLLMLEDSNTGEVVGCSALKSLVGLDKPFFSFKLLNIVQSSAVAKRRFDMQVMLLVNEYSGTSEVGTLFVKPKMRGTGAGRLISQARYMFIAAAPTRFSDTVISELRGHVTKDGHSPFWEALGRKFFKMDFSEADEITAQTDNQFITDLMPKYPIYKELLSEEAQAVIGKTHPDGKGARRLLEEEGFRYEKFVDIFDAGPTMVAPRDEIRTVRDSRLYQVVREVPDTLGPRRALVSNNKVKDFRAGLSRVSVSTDNTKVELDEKTSKTLNIKPGQKVRVYLLPRRQNNKA